MADDIRFLDAEWRVFRQPYFHRDELHAGYEVADGVAFQQSDGMWRVRPASECHRLGEKKAE